MELNIFETLTRKKIRFKAKNGNISLEDLWDLSLEELDTIAVELDKEANTTTKSFINKRNPANKLAKQKLDAVLRVIEIKISDKERAERNADTRERKARIMEIIASKKDAALEGASLKKLQEQLAGIEEELEED